MRLAYYQTHNTTVLQHWARDGDLMPKTAFCIDFYDKNEKHIALDKLEVLEYDASDFLAELEEFGHDRVREWSDDFRKVFATYEDAESYLDTHVQIYAAIENGDYKTHLAVPGLTHRLHMMVFTCCGMKSKTRRSFKRPWERGQIFNLHIRSGVGITVRLVSDIFFEKETEQYCYEFEMV